MKTLLFLLSLVFCLQTQAQQVECNVDFIKAIGVFGNDILMNFEETEDSNLIILRDRYYDSPDTLFLSKIDWNGNIIWNIILPYSMYGFDIYPNMTENRNFLIDKDTLYLCYTSSQDRNITNTYISNQPNECCRWNPDLVIKKINLINSEILASSCFDLESDGSNVNCRYNVSAKLFNVNDNKYIVVNAVHVGPIINVHYGAEGWEGNAAYLKLNNNLSIDSVYVLPYYVDNTQKILFQQSKPNNKPTVQFIEKDRIHPQNNEYIINSLLYLNNGLHPTLKGELYFAAYGTVIYSNMLLRNDTLIESLVRLRGSSQFWPSATISDTEIYFFRFSINDLSNIIYSKNFSTNNSFFCDNLYLNHDNTYYAPFAKKIGQYFSHSIFNTSIGKFDSNFNLIYKKEFYHTDSLKTCRIVKTIQKPNENVWMSVANVEDYTGDFNVCPPEHDCRQDNKDIILIRTSERVVGINEPLSAQIQMQIQPNPSAGNSQIILNTQGYILQNAAINIHDISGKKVLEQTLENSLQASYKTVPLNTDKLIAGVYFVSINGKISQNPFSKTIKFIKQ